jgi:hypothetical protein
MKNIFNFIKNLFNIKKEIKTEIKDWTEILQEVHKKRMEELK